MSCSSVDFPVQTDVDFPGTRIGPECLPWVVFLPEQDVCQQLIQDSLLPPVRAHPNRDYIVIWLANQAVLDVLRVVRTRANPEAYLSEQS